MRLLFLFLLLVIAVNGFFGSSLTDRVKAMVSGAKNVGQKVKNATIVGFKKLFNNTVFFKAREKLRHVKDKVVKTLKLTPARIKELTKKLQNMKTWFFKRDRVKQEGDSVDEVNNHSGVVDDLYQFDVVLTEQQADEITEEIEELVKVNSTTALPRKKRQAYKDKEKYLETLWSDGVNYYFHALSSEKLRSVFVKAAKLWEKDTCIDIRENRDAKDRILVFPEQGLNTNDNYGMKYDYGSLLHYGGTTASFNRKPTMVPFDEKYQQTLGSPFISFIDLSMINEHYKCKDKCDPAKSAKCHMGGFPHPRNCQKCICPGGYGGDFCNEKPSGCGRIIQASSAWERFEDEVGRGRGEDEDFTTCNYWIESPEGSEIEVRLLDFSPGFSVDGCKYAGVEIKTNEDQTLTGYRFCSRDASKITLRSYTNRVPIITYNRIYSSKVTLEYRHVPARNNEPKPDAARTSAPKQVASFSTTTTTPKPLTRPTTTTTSKPLTRPATTTTVKPRASLPTTTTTTQSLVKTGSGFRCVDNASCPSLKASGFCDKMGLSAATKLKVCPKSCGFC
ncbi:Zinc metalloproteinase [Trichostrongylus colubriformis]|uniref:Zinc metalloproteinase n=1 Tax=Trichostrongylus colubriformis TaxID=6319 RepID=A0AAN8F7P3_TRICO